MRVETRFPTSSYVIKTVVRGQDKKTSPKQKNYETNVHIDKQYFYTVHISERKRLLSLPALAADKDSVCVSRRLTGRPFESDESKKINRIKSKLKTNANNLRCVFSHGSNQL